ncbi:MAG: tRNA (adenosine(37)-N6)-dimethylallyltransferase MiaA [Thermoleophilia bacterium]
MSGIVTHGHAGASEPAGSAEGGPRVVALFGPTGVGKTAVAVELAVRLGVRVISCDSMQIYRDFPVLTNQPGHEERRGVEHEFVGVADPEEEWNAADYGRMAQVRIDEDVRVRGRAVIAGGTGLYLRAALAPLAIPPASDPERLEALRLRAETEGAEALHRELEALDPEAAARISAQNVRRVVRALEVTRALGPGGWSRRDDLWAPEYRHPTLLVALTAERSELYRRVNERVVTMLRDGALEEVRRHREAVAPNEVSGPPRGARRAIGYREITAYLEGRLSLEDVADRMAAATRRYIRRQTTWMRKLEGAVIIDTSLRSAEAVADEIFAAAGAAFAEGASDGMPDRADAQPDADAGTRQGTKT